MAHDYKTDRIFQINHLENNMRHRALENTFDGKFYSFVFSKVGSILPQQLRELGS